MTHSPTPWHISFDDGRNVRAKSGYNIATECKKDDAKRIVVCVNFLADMPTETLQALLDHNTDASKIMIDGIPLTERLENWANLVKNADKLNQPHAPMSFELLNDIMDPEEDEESDARAEMEADFWNYADPDSWEDYSNTEWDEVMASITDEELITILKGISYLGGDHFAEKMVALDFYEEKRSEIYPEDYKVNDDADQYGDWDDEANHMSQDRQQPGYSEASGQWN